MPAAFSARAFANPDKCAELVALVQAYEGYLAGHKVADTAAVFTEALRHLDECAVGPDDPRLTLPDVLWPPLTRRFIDALPGHDATENTAIRRPPGLTIPSRLTLERPPSPVAPASARSAGDGGSGTDAASLRFLMTPEEAPPPRADGTLTMLRAGGKEAEIKEVFRRVDLPPLIGPLSMREIESDVPSHQPARSAVSVTTTSARA